MLIDVEELILRLKDQRRSLQDRRCITVTQERERAFTVAGLDLALKVIGTQPLVGPSTA